MHKALTFVVFSVLSLTAFAEPPKPGTLREQLMQADRDFAAAAKARGLDGWLGFMADDVVRLPKLGSKAVVGKAAVRKVDADLFADKSLSLRWTPTDGGAFQDGTHGFTTGKYEVVKRETNGTEKVIARGSYVTCWRKDKDGNWRVILDTGAPEPAQK